MPKLLVSSVSSALGLNTVEMLREMRLEVWKIARVNDFWAGGGVN